MRNNGDSPVGRFFSMPRSGGIDFIYSYFSQKKRIEAVKLHTYAFYFAFFLRR